ncbi:MAG: ABC-ATPase domain-containing protein [Myxococcota bacterium]
MRDAEDLRETLRRIDGRGYKAYKDIRGTYRLGGWTLCVDHVQGDPFAAPSRLRLQVPAGEAAFPAWATSGVARHALADLLTRAFDDAVAALGQLRRGSGKSGLLGIERPTQEILRRTSVVVHPDHVEARFVAGLPARGRRVLGRQAAQQLLEDVPAVARRSLLFEALDPDAVRRHVEAVEDQEALRAALADRGLVAFVADGSRLPRRSGVDPRPLTGQVVPFEAPEALAVEVDLPHAGRVRGMGIPEGVTLIVGGGYHGKSTLLNAVELGVWNHVPGDGRERVAARADTVKIRAEDGRRVECVDISPFIDNLPFGRDTRAFRSDDASGSTSQAANIAEALEVGAGVLLMDEDTSATNFMIRDHRMQALVAKDREPITPYIDKVRQLHRDHGVSSVIVVGGAGDYFDVADTVILMDTYEPRDATAEAKRIAERHGEPRVSEGGDVFGDVHPRRPAPSSIDPRRGKRPVKVQPRGLDHIRFGEWDLDLSAVEQLVDPCQTRTVGQALVYLRDHLLDGERTLSEALDLLDDGFAREGLDLLARGRSGDLAEVRRFEIAAALNRLRSLSAEQ